MYGDGKQELKYAVLRFFFLSSSLSVELLFEEGPYAPAPMPRQQSRPNSRTEQSQPQSECSIQFDLNSEIVIRFRAFIGGGISTRPTL